MREARLPILDRPSFQSLFSLSVLWLLRPRTRRLGVLSLLGRAMKRLSSGPSQIPAIALKRRRASTQMK